MIQLDETAIKMRRFFARKVGFHAEMQSRRMDSHLSDRTDGVEAIKALSRRKKVGNIITGMMCVGLAAGTYAWIIVRMKENDPLKAVEEEAKVNLHKSGLKITYKPVETDDSATNKVLSMEKSKGTESNVEDPSLDSKKQKTLGWKKYIFFGPRSGE